MKKLFSFSLIVVSLCALINCSPKTAKKTASSQPAAVKKEVVLEEAEIKKLDEVAVLEKVDADADAGKATSGTPFGDLSSDEQLTMYNDMAPLRAEIGKKIFTVRCNKCHKYFPPESRNGENWLHVMTKMGPKANLNTDEYLEVTAYLVQNAKK